MNDNVTSLKGMCRKAIKNSIGNVYYKKKVETLPLPKQLQNYLLHLDVVPTQNFFAAHYEMFKAKQEETKSLPEMFAIKLKTQGTKSKFRIVKS